MKRIMMISIAVAVLLLCGESVQAQSRVSQRPRTERRVRDERPPREPRRQNIRIAEPPKPVIKMVDADAIHAIERESFDHNRLKMTQMIISTGGLMTTSQIIAISKAFDFDNNRVQFLTMAYPNCIDKALFYKVLGTIDFNSSKEKIIDYVINFKHDNPDRRPPVNISNAEMNEIVKVLKNESFDSTRKKLAGMIISGSILTSRQIASMAKTFDFDTNRYDFLLLASHNCSDLHNYVIAANTLDFDTNKRRLMDEITRKP